MSAALWWYAFILGTRVADSIFTQNGSKITSEIVNHTMYQGGNGFFKYNFNRKIVVEEVDKHGNSVVKELELPDYEDGEEQQREKEIILSEEKREKKSRSNKGAKDLYGCHNRKESQQKKCLQRKKKFIKCRYKSWKALFRQIIKDLDGKIKTIERNSGKETARGGLNFLSGFSPKNSMRKKE